jgi:hypothetical protein
MVENGATLEYASEARGARRKWARWALAALLIILVGSGFCYRQPILRRARVLYWQRQCMTYTRPPGTPVTTTTRPSAANDRDYERFPRTRVAVFGASPECWRQFEAARGSSFTGIRALGVPSGPNAVFLHQRVSPAGHRRLVRVESIYANALRPQYGYAVTVVVPGSLWREPRDVGPRFGFAASGRFEAAERLFGQPDPHDASHFTIDYAVDGELLGTVDAWLRDDDTVDFKLRDPASTRWLSKPRVGAIRFPLPDATVGAAAGDG